MSFFKRLLGKKPSHSISGDASAQPTPEAAIPAVPEQESAPAAGEAGPAPATQASSPDAIRTIDEQGREVMVPRQEWREKFLLPHLEKVWNEPDQLAGTILHAFNDGFLTDLLEPAEQLMRIDTNPERGAVILSVVYRELERLESAEAVLRQQIEKHGESATVLVNLAKVQVARGEGELSQATLWHAFELDPNQAEGFAWCAATSQAENGAAPVLKLVQRIAALPGSWRARLWLARVELEQKQIDAAVRLYREALDMAGKPAPTELLVQMSADLGQAGYAAVMLREVALLFEAGVHGLPVANNLFRACLETGEFDAARGLLDHLYAQQRLEWKQQLGFWDGELAKVRAAAIGAKQKDASAIAILVDDGPVWLPAHSPARELFPVPTAAAVTIAFLGSSAEVAAPAEGEPTAARQLSDLPGRLSRAIPLFLAEQVRFGGTASVRPIVPWMRGDAPAFVLGRQPWTAAEVAHHAKAAKPPCDFAVVTHLQAVANIWRGETRLVRASDAAVVGTAVAEFSPMTPEEGVRGLAGELLLLLQREAGVVLEAPPAEYQVPTGRDFGLYLLRLEQLLAVRCNTMIDAAPGFFGGEREVLDGALHLCLTQPENVPSRLIFAQLLRQLVSGRPQVVAEYRAKVQLLQKDKPVSGPAGAIIERMFGSLYA